MDSTKQTCFRRFKPPKYFDLENCLLHLASSKFSQGEQHGVRNYIGNAECNYTSDTGPLDSEGVREGDDEVLAKSEQISVSGAGRIRCKVAYDMEMQVKKLGKLVLLLML